RGYRLGHRVDAEDRVLAHLLVALDIHMAADAGMDELTLAPDVGKHAGQIAAIDIAALHHVIQPRQPRRRHAYRFGVHPCPPVGWVERCETHRLQWLRWVLRMLNPSSAVTLLVISRAGKTATRCRRRDRTFPPPRRRSPAA